MPSDLKYQFDQYEADVNAAELRRNGNRLKLQMQPFQVLVALLERPRQVVTREELRLRLWPQDTFVDFDHSLNTAIAKLRDVLGDSAASPRYIETIAKRGYRFLGDVRILQEETGAIATADRAAPATARAADTATSVPVAGATGVGRETELPRASRATARAGRGRDGAATGSRGGGSARV